MREAAVKRPLDRVLPAWHHRERHSVAVAAPPERALAAAREVTAAEMPLVRLLFRLRGLRPAANRPLWEVMAEGGFQQLEPDLLVLVAKPWHPLGKTRRVDDFAAFAEPGWAKAAVDFTAADGRLVTETRIWLTDARARRRFRAYWLFVRPFSGLTRRGWLRAAKRRAEA